MKETFPYLMFDGKSSLDLHMYIVSKGSYRGAQRDVSYQSVPGRNGDLVIDNGRYKNISIPYKMNILDKTPFGWDKLTHLIKGWLLSRPGYLELWDSYDPDYYRLASYSDEVDIEQQLREVGSVNLKFNCKPFKYSFEGKKMVVLTSSGSIIYNPEFYNSKPYIKIVGSGTIILSINSNSFTFTDVDGYIELDSETMNCYKGLVNENTKMYSTTFPELEPGINNISWTGTVSEVDIIPRWNSL